MAVELAPTDATVAPEGLDRARMPLAVAAERAMPWLAGALAFGVYAATLAPTVGIGDSPELSAAAITLGVPHPTGYPLFVLLGHAWSQAFSALSAVDPAWALNLLTALCASVAVAAVAAAGRRLSGRASGGWLAAGVFGYGPVFWSQATLVEVYALHLAFAATILWTALRFDAAACRGDDTRGCVRGLALLCGLSLTVHMMTVLVLPFLAVLLLHHWRRWWSVREAVILAATGLAPLSIYAALPLIAASDPLVNWGNPEELDAFWFHVTGGQYHQHVGGIDSSLGDVLLQVPGRVARETGIVLLPLAALGAWRLRGPRGLAMAVGFAAALAFGMSWGVVDNDAFYLNALMVVALWVGVGSAAACGWMGGRTPGAARALEAVLWLTPLALLGLGFGHADRQAEYSPHDHAVAALAAVPPNAVILTSGPAGYPPVYAQLVEELRPDVQVVDLYLNVRNQYGPELDRLRQSRLPDTVTRELAVTETVARLDGGSRSLWLMPGVPEEAWDRLGLTRLQAGVLHPLVRGAPDLRVAPPTSAPLAAFENGPTLLDASLQQRRVEAGTGLTLSLTWQLADTGAGAPTVGLVLADADGEAPAGRDGLPLFEDHRPLALGAGLERYAPGDVIREQVHLVLPRRVPAGSWWLWVSLRRGDTWHELADGRLFARAVDLEVTPRTTPLWTLPGTRPADGR